MNTDLEELLRENACVGNVDKVSELIQSGVNPNSQNKVNGWTALHWASKRGHNKIVKLLLDASANPEIKNNKGETAADLNKSTVLLRTPNVRNQEIDFPFSNEPTKRFIPNYLKNPPFPYVEAKVQKKSTEDHKQDGFYYKVNSPKTVAPTQWTPSGLFVCPEQIIFKLRMKGDIYFKEIEFDRNADFTLDQFKKLCIRCLRPCDTQITNTADIKVIKLPDTILQNNIDFKRLTDYQCLEILLNDDDNS